MTKYVLNIIFCFVLVNFSGAQNNTFKTGKPTTKHYYTEIPYKNVRGKLIIPVTINNTSYRFLFDTGAPNLISSTLLKEIGNNKYKSISVRDANQNRQRMKLTTIPLLTIGEVSFKNTSALVFDEADNLVFDCFEIDGIIGSNLLRKSIVQIQPKRNLFIITNNRNKLQLNKSKGIELMLRSNQSSPYITVKIKGNKNANEHVLIDTGASGLYDMCKTNYKVLEQQNVLSYYASGSGASSIGLFGTPEAQTQYQVKLPEMEIGGHLFKNVSTITSGDDNSRIGSDILKYGGMTIDFKHKRFYFNAFNTTSDATENDFGFTPTIKNNKLIVGVIWDETLKSKLNSGDEILKINDLDLSTLDLCDLITKPSPFLMNDTIQIVIKNNNGNTTSFDLKKN
ncbi:aspartyl protease family protein [Aestuariivivens insulae]|uniref:aspartyl protease family protein n=1 Tax=Aestuariivivens insulae TaxID=1621988 RepID=UPI001F56F38D|nr:aspartyl protease family protein [Aestuariivivens insulae]